MRGLLFIGSLALATGPAHAQLLSWSGVDIAVQGGAQLTIKGDALAGAGGSITNSGTIDMSGDLTNNSGSGIFTSVPGTVIMNGTGQTIGGSDQTTFDQLDLQCATLDLQQDVLVGGTYAVPTGVLALNDALMQLNSNRLVVNNGLPTALTRINGQIVSETGPLPGYGDVQWMIRTNTGTYTLPFGDGVNYLPLILQITTAGVTSGSFHFATYPTDPFATPNNRPLPSGLPVLTDQMGSENAPNVLDRYWIISTEEYPTDPVATLTFTYRDNEWNTGTNTIGEALLQAQRWNGSVWSNPPVGVVNTLANTVVAPGVADFSEVWTLVQSSTPLPVELLGFRGERENAQWVRLFWSTATEHNNAGFEVWRMIEGEPEFTYVGWVDGSGDSQGTLNYTLPDPNGTERTSYYRLKQVDNDGQFTWSPITAVAGASAWSTLVVYPNPATDMLMIGGLPEGSGRIDLIDATGRSVRSWTARAVLEGLGDLPRGAYSLRAEGTHAATSVRVVLH